MRIRFKMPMDAIVRNELLVRMVPIKNTHFVRCLEAWRVFTVWNSYVELLHDSKRSSPIRAGIVVLLDQERSEVWFERFAPGTGTRIVGITSFEPFRVQRLAKRFINRPAGWMRKLFKKAFHYTASRTSCRFWHIWNSGLKHSLYSLVRAIGKQTMTAIKYRCRYAFSDDNTSQSCEWCMPQARSISWALRGSVKCAI